MISYTRAGLAALAFSLLPAGLQCATLTLDFTYSNVTAQFPTATSSGSGTGSFTLTFTTAGLQPAGALTAFAFSDTINEASPSPSTSTFNYNLSSVADSTILLGGDLAHPSFVFFTLDTNPVQGSNALIGTDSVSLDLVQGTGSTQTGLDQGYDTTGVVTLTPVASTPEPSSLPLLAVLFAAGAIAFTRRSSYCDKLASRYFR